MGRDFPNDPVRPQGNDNLFGPEESGKPKTGFEEAPLTPQDRGGPGPGVPPSKRKIH